MIPIYHACFLLAMFVRLLSSHVAESYFPPNVFGEDEDVADYAMFLTAMEEAPLWKRAEQKPGAEVYRLFWLPSFHSAMSVRIVKENETHLLHAVQLKYKGDSNNGGRPGKIIVRKTKKLTEEQWTRVQVYLAQCDFLDMKPNEVVKGLGGTDGDYLILECVENGKYHVVKRSDSEPSYEKLCHYILELSGLDIKEAWETYHDGPEKNDPEE